MLELAGWQTGYQEHLGGSLFFEPCNSLFNVENLLFVFTVPPFVFFSFSFRHSLSSTCTPFHLVKKKMFPFYFLIINSFLKYAL